MLEKFKKMSLARKIIVGFLVLSTLASLFDGRFFGALVTGVIAYYLFVSSGLEATNNYQASQSDDEFDAQQRDEDDAYMLRKEEDERLEQERQINEIAFRG